MNTQQNTFTGEHGTSTILSITSACCKYIPDRLILTIFPVQKINQPKDEREDKPYRIFNCPSNGA